MTKKEVIDAIKYMQEYQTETDRLEAKTAEKGCPQKCYDTMKKTWRYWRNGTKV